MLLTVSAAQGNWGSPLLAKEGPPRGERQQGTAKLLEMSEHKALDPKLSTTERVVKARAGVEAEVKLCSNQGSLRDPVLAAAGAMPFMGEEYRRFIQDLLGLKEMDADVPSL
ncbi:UNVERIFIED_CONTAM: hypothetical protein K2H54_032044 [Gekko kuhli]